MDLVQHTASLPRGSGQWKSCTAVDHGLGAIGSAARAMHFLAA